MTYQQALDAGNQAGWNRAAALPLLAAACQTLSMVHAIAPALVYAGAVKRGLNHKQLLKLAEEDCVALGNLMFEE